MAPRKFRGPGLMGWVANEAEWLKRERRRREANRNQFSDRRPAATPKPKPQPWTQQQIDRLSGAVQRIGARNGLSFNGSPPSRPQPAGAPQPPRPASSNNSGSTSSSRGSGSSTYSRPAPKPAAPKAPDKFKGTAEEGRKLWIEKYSSDKYKDQAIGKKARQFKADMSAGPSANAQEYGDYLKRKNKGK